MKKLPFVTNPNRKTTEEIVEIGTESAGKIKMLKKGGISYNEKKALDRIIDELSGKFEAKPASSSTDLQMFTVSFAFQNRVVQVDKDGKEVLDTNGKILAGLPDWTHDDTILNYEGNVEIYDLIFEFINNEKLGWKNQKYLTKYEGLDADLQAKDYAEKNGLVAASDGKDWYVFKVKGDVPSTFMIPGEKGEDSKGKKSN